MITVQRPHPTFSETASHRGGGFLWWYVDLVDDSGNGFVLIWSLGLPFLPGRDLGASARSRPSLSLGYYRDGRQELYLLQAYPESAAALDPHTGSGKLGDSRFLVSEQAGQVEVEVHLDEPVPAMRSRLTGTLRLSGRAFTPTLMCDEIARTDDADAGDDSDSPVHLWSPQTTLASAELTLRLADRQYEMKGAGYFDSNVSQCPLTDQGISSWRWGRLRFPTYALTYYHLSGEAAHSEAHGLLQTTQGHVYSGPATVLPDAIRRGLYGLDVPQSLLVEVDGQRLNVGVTATLEEGPFYQRGLIRAVDNNGDVGIGFSEVVAPDSIGVGWQQPLIEMRTHRVGQKNSAWLPLFVGPRQGRCARLVRSLSGGQL